MDGLYRYRDDVLRTFGPTGGVPAAKVRTILPQTPDDVLIGTEAGIFRVQGEHVARLPGTESLSGTFVPRMAWLRPDLLAITTMDRGLGLLRDGKLLLLGPDAGIPSANGWTLDVIGNYLYASSIDGAYRIALSDLPIRPRNRRSDCALKSSLKAVNAAAAAVATGAATAAAMHARCAKVRSCGSHRAQARCVWIRPRCRRRLRRPRHVSNA